MSKVLITVMLLALLGASAPALGQQEDCNDYCSPSDAACNLLWADIHTYFHVGGCSNFDEEGSSAPGHCRIEFLDPRDRYAGYGEIDCLGNTCEVVGAIRCGGSLKPYSVECQSNDGSTPQATAEPGGGSCRFGTGSNYQGTGAGCDSSTGQIFYYNFGS